MDIREFRRKYPQYDDLSDDDLTRRLHGRFYSDMPFERFSVAFMNPESVSVSPMGPPDPVDSVRDPQAVQPPSRLNAPLGPLAPPPEPLAPAGAGPADIPLGFATRLPEHDLLAALRAPEPQSAIAPAAPVTFVPPPAPRPAIGSATPAAPAPEIPMPMPRPEQSLWEALPNAVARGFTEGAALALSGAGALATQRPDRPITTDPEAMEAIKEVRLLAELGRYEEASRRIMEIPGLLDAARFGLQHDLREVARGERAAADLGMIRHGLPGFDPDRNPLMDASEAVRQFSEEKFPLTPEREEQFPVKVARGVGSFGTTAATGLALAPFGMPAAVLGTLGLTTAMGAGEAHQRAKEAGASIDQQIDAAIMGLAPGAIDMLPVANILKPFTHLAPWASTRIRAAIYRGLEEGIIEGTTEGVQQFVQNVIARVGYAPDQDLLEGVLENALVGGAVGKIIGTPIGAIRGPDEQPTPGESRLEAVPPLPPPPPVRSFPPPVAPAETLIGAQPPIPPPQVEARPQSGAGEAQAPIAGGFATPPAPPPQSITPASDLAEVLDAVDAGATPEEAVAESRRRQIAAAIKQAGIEAEEGSIVAVTLPDGSVRYGRVDAYDIENGELVVELSGLGASQWRHRGPAEDVLLTPISPATVAPAVQSDLLAEAAGDGPLTPDAVAAALGIQPDDAGRMLSDMESAGLVRRDGNVWRTPRSIQAEIEAAETATAEPTPGQAEAGNYRKGKVRLHGLEVSIETPKGAERTGVDARGRPWSVEMPAAYGYIRRTEGADGSQIDAYIGDDPTAENVYVIDQFDPDTGLFDEHKVVLNAGSASEAKLLYLQSFNDGQATVRFGGLRRMSPAEFKAWLSRGDTKAPVSDPGIERARLAAAKAEAEKERPDDPQAEGQMGGAVGEGPQPGDLRQPGGSVSGPTEQDSATAPEGADAGAGSSIAAGSRSGVVGGGKSGERVGGGRASGDASEARGGVERLRGRGKRTAGSKGGVPDRPAAPTSGEDATEKGGGGSVVGVSGVSGVEGSGVAAGPSGVATDPSAVLKPEPKPEPRTEKKPEPAEVDTTDESGEAIYETYTPQIVPFSDAPKHPTPLVESAAMSSVSFPEVTYVPNLPPKARAALSDAQIETVALAGRAHSEMLSDNVRRRGFFVGDGTGVGKGRQIAGIIMDNWQNGRTKAVWVSKNNKLFDDAVRDWTSLGGAKGDLFNVGKTKAGSDLKQQSGIMFVTYDALRSKASFVPGGALDKAAGNARIKQIEKWLPRDFDGVIAFDESHLMGSAIGEGSGAARKDPAQRALAGLYLQRAFPRARVVYLSATGATEVHNLAYADRLGLWGIGTPFANVETFVSVIKSGGLAAMEIMARDLKQLGLYTARSLSMRGVHYERLEHKLTPEQKVVYGRIAEAWRNVLAQFEAYEKKLNHDRRKNMFRRAAFWATNQRFFNQLITSMQVPSLLDAIEADIASGHAVVVQFVNHYAAQVNRALAERADEMDDDADVTELFEDIDLSPKEMLINLVRDYFPVEQYETFVGEDGRTYTRPVHDSNGNPVLNKDAVAARDSLLADLSELAAPLGPIDMLLHQLGPEQVAEVTGRSKRVLIRDGRQVIESRSAEAANKAEIDAFQNDRKRILIFSMAGGVGASYHADLGVKNQRLRRHYVLQPGWVADACIQGFGRTHRTNQKQPPEYILLTTDLPSQKRFVSSIARRIEQLGALTKGQRQATTSVFSAGDNLEGPYSSAALEMFFKGVMAGDFDGISRDDLIEELGLERVVSRDGNLSKNLPPVPQFLNRLLSVAPDRQGLYFDAFLGAMQSLIDAAAASGTLDTGLQNLRADSLKLIDNILAWKDQKTGAETRLVTVSAINKRHILTWDMIRKRYELKDFRINRHSGRIWAGGAKRTQTGRDGRVTLVRDLWSPGGRGQAIPHQQFDDPNTWDRVASEADAKALWERDAESVPKTTERQYHMLTGMLLPIWDRIPQSGRIYRVALEDGSRLIGREVPPDNLETTREKLRIGRPKINMTAAEVYTAVMDGRVVTLSNGWFIRPVRVANERRIEVVGPYFADRELLSRAGVFTEEHGRIRRHYVPIGPKAEHAIQTLMLGREIIRVATDEDVAFSRANLNDQPRRMRAPSLSDEGRIPYALPGGSVGYRDPLLKASRAKLALEVGKELERILGSSFKAEIFDTLSFPPYAPDGGVAGLATRNLIALALVTKDGLSDGVVTARHEVIHLLRRIGAFTDAEWKKLREASKRKWRKKYDIDRRYYDFRMTDAALDEEGIAEAFAYFRRGDDIEASNIIKRAFQKLRRLLRAVAVAVRRAFGDPSLEAEKILAQIDAGLKRGEVANAYGVEQPGSVRFAVPPLNPQSRSALDKAATLAGQHVAKAPTLRDAITNWLAEVRAVSARRIMQSMVDRYHSLLKYERALTGVGVGRPVAGPGTRFDASDPRAAFTAAHFASNLAAVMHVVANEAHVRWNAAQQSFEVDHSVPGFLKIFEPLNRRELVDAFEHYAWARRANELKQQGREPSPQSDIDAGLALAEHFPELVTVFDNWLKFNRRTLEIARDAGLISSDQMARLSSDMHYVPFYRAGFDSIPVGRRGIEGQRSGIRRLKGSKLATRPIIENMLENTQRLLDSSYKNIAMQKAVRMMLAVNGSLGEVVIRKAPKAWLPSLVPMSMLERFLLSSGITSVDFSALSPDEKRSLALVFGMVPPTMKRGQHNIVSVMHAGKPQFYVLEDDLLFQSLASMSPRQWSKLGEIAWSLLTLPSRLVRTTVTHEPGFAIRNFLRDTAATLITTGGSPKHIATTVQAIWRDLVRDSPEALATMAHGSGIGGWWQHDPRSTAKIVRRMASSSPLSRLRRAGGVVLSGYRQALRASEQANRLALRDQLLAKGVSDAEAAFQAMDLLNFSARGASPLVRGLMEMTPFLNARLQGMWRMVRASGAAGGAASREVLPTSFRSTRVGFLINGAILAALSLGLWAINKDDDDYKDLDEWERDTWWMIRLPPEVERQIGARWLRIPKPFEVGLLFATVPERLASGATDTEDWGLVLSQIAKNARDAMAFEPTIIGSIAIEQLSNEERFTGRPIVGAAEERLPPRLQANEYTSRTIKEATDAANAVLPDALVGELSPQRVEHVYRSIFTTIGSYLLMATDAVFAQVDGVPQPSRTWTQTPVAGSFLREGVRRTKWMQRYYDARREVEQLTATVKRLSETDPEGAARLASEQKLNERRAYFSAAEGRGKKAFGLQDLRKERSAIRADRSMSPDEKRRRLDEIQQRMNEIYRSVERYEATLH